jgi:hypothetical protein
MSKNMHHFQETLLQQHVTAQPGRKNLEATTYKKFESVLPEWFRQR